MTSRGGRRVCQRSHTAHLPHKRLLGGRPADLAQICRKPLMRAARYPVFLNSAPTASRYTGHLSDTKVP